ncbi:hypothetical protein Hanom_Chr06g00529381 [Helianthus anomalus]
MQQDTYNDMMFFHIDFVFLYFTTMASSHMNGYVNDKILKRLTADTRSEEYDWCAYIVDCLRKCKKKWKPKYPNSWWVGALTILTFLYVDIRELAALITRAGLRAIQFWTRDMLTRRQDYETSNGGFGQGNSKAISVGAVDAGDDVDEETFANKHEVVDCVEKCVDRLAAVRVKIEMHLGARLTEDPNNKGLPGLKRRYIDVLNYVPVWPTDGSDSFEEGQMFKRALTNAQRVTTRIFGLLSICFCFDL